MKLLKRCGELKRTSVWSLLQSVSDKDIYLAHSDFFFLLFLKCILDDVCAANPMSDTDWTPCQK